MPKQKSSIRRLYITLSFDANKYIVGNRKIKECQYYTFSYKDKKYEEEYKKLEEDIDKCITLLKRNTTAVFRVSTCIYPSDRKIAPSDQEVIDNTNWIFTKHFTDRKKPHSQRFRCLTLVEGRETSYRPISSVDIKKQILEYFEGGLRW